MRRETGTDAPVLTITGGSITGNTAKAHEGGGIRLEGTGAIDPHSRPYLYHGITPAIPERTWAAAGSLWPPIAP